MSFMVNKKLLTNNGWNMIWGINHIIFCWYIICALNKMFGFFSSFLLSIFFLFFIFYIYKYSADTVQLIVNSLTCHDWVLLKQFFTPQREAEVPHSNTLLEKYNCDIHLFEVVW